MDSDIIFCTLSVGKNYTVDYTSKIAEDVLRNTKSRIAITTDFPGILQERFANDPRVLIDYFDRSLYKIRLPMGPNPGSNGDFNFNLRYTALKQCLGVPEKFVFFTDCDNSLPTWDESIVHEKVNSLVDRGYDFFAPRADFKLRQAINTYLSEVSIETPRPTNFWHKFWAFDLINYPRPEWDDAPLPGEYFFVLTNHDGKLEKFYEGWKRMHDWLAGLPYTWGTWAEAVEIGIASKIAGYTAYDINWSHEGIGGYMVASGHKIGHATSGHTEEN